MAASTEYQSLRPPEVGILEESDENSIQGSPLLDTESRFSGLPPSGPVEGAYPDSYDLGSSMPYDSAYDDPYAAPLGGGYGETNASGYTSSYDPYSVTGNAAPAPPSGPPVGPPASAYPRPGASNQAGFTSRPLSGTKTEMALPPAGPPTGPLSGPGPGMEAAVRPTGSPSGPLSGPPTGPMSGPGPISRPHLDSQGGSHIPSVGSISKNRMSLPTHVAYGDREDSVGIPSVHSTLKFGAKQRPQSTLIRKSFQYDKSNSRGSLDDNIDDDDDDALPFEATKQMASQGRPQGAIQLSQLHTGMVMSKDNFESYRKSVASLEMLQRVGSTASRTSPRKTKTAASDFDFTDGKDSLAEKDTLDTDSRRREGSAAEGEDEEDDEDEFLTTDKERKRRLAKERQKQEARMSVYRQRMTKVIGGSPGLGVATTLDSVSIDAQKSEGGAEEEDDDEELMDDIPLSILRAHRFPKTRRKSNNFGGNTPPPGNFTANSSPGSRPASMAEATLLASPSTPTLGPARPMSISSSRMLGPPPSMMGGLPNANPASQPLSRVFGNSDGAVSRGLVGEIAKEEQIRKRRQTLSVNQVQNPHLMQASPSPPPSGGHNAMPASDQAQAQSIEALQTRLDFVIDMLTRMNGGDANQLPAGLAPNGAVPLGQVSGTPVSGNVRAFQAKQRAPSIRTMSTYQSLPKSSAYSLRTASMTPASLHYQGPSMVAPQVSAPALAPAPAARVANRPSRMRLVNVKDDEDDEAEWEKLMLKRQALRAQWKQEAASS